MLTVKLSVIVTSEIKRETVRKYYNAILSGCVTCNIGRAVNKTSLLARPKYVTGRVRGNYLFRNHVCLCR